MCLLPVCWLRFSFLPKSFITLAFCCLLRQPSLLTFLPPLFLVILWAFLYLGPAHPFLPVNLTRGSRCSVTIPDLFLFFYHHETSPIQILLCMSPTLDTWTLFHILVKLKTTTYMSTIIVTSWITMPVTGKQWHRKSKKANIPNIFDLRSHVCSEAAFLMIFT